MTAGLPDIHSETDMRTNIFALAALTAVMLAAIPARAEDEHRELGPHVHGHGTLDIAVEGKRVAMELEVPGMDIVGFEHQASTDAQKAAVDKATAQLEEPLTLFKVPEAAGCSVKEAKVALEAEHEHDAHDAKEDKHEEHAHDEDGHDGHTAFHVTYALDCETPAALTEITFYYFNAFSGARSLTVNLVTPKAQSKYEVARDKPQLDLTGMM